jgi:hypothetical protein
VPINISPDRQALIQKLIEKRQPASRAAAPTARAVRGDATVPLSSSQRQIWLHNRLTPDVPLYNEPFTIHRRGSLDVACLARSLNEVISRHEILRTTFPIVDGEPVQAVQPHLEIHIPVYDLSSESEAIELATADALRPFDLAAGPLIRARLVRLRENDYRLFLTLHHLIFDGVSIYHVLLPELAAVYEAFSKGEPSPLPGPEFQYADYTLWQRERVGEQGPKEQLGYWKTQLRTPRPRTTLRAERARPQFPSYPGTLYPFLIEQQLAEALKQLARECGASLYMVLLAAFNLLLYQSTGQDDVVIGTVTAGRYRPEFARTFGFFLNPLVLRTSLADPLTFRELVVKVRRVVLEALDNADVPFEFLARTLDSNRDPGRNPFFDVLFSLEPPGGTPPSGWDLTQTRVDIGLSKFDLSLEFDERVDGLDGRFVYNTDLFDRSTIERLHHDWMTLLTSIARQPDSPVCGTRIPVTPTPPDLGTYHRPFIGPRTATERVLAEIWAEILLWDGPIGITDSFFHLGGHSLLIARLQHAIERRFGKMLEIRDIYTSPTIERIAALL